MLLIADGGSTKTSWCLIDPTGSRFFFNSEGYNPYFVNSEYIVASLKEVLPPSVKALQVHEIFFYGAGVQNQQKAAVVKKALKIIFPKSTSFVGHDLLASARALLGSKPGFAAILGTGTNSCLYNGSEIIYHIDSGAHILGDEGSGFYIGKNLLIDFMRGDMPKEVALEFKNAYQLTADDIHEAVYSGLLPNRYCAGFSKFITDNNVKDLYLRDLVKSSFNDFFKKIVSKYPDFKQHTFNCIGSVGYNFQEILLEVVSEWGMQPGNIIKSPLGNLVDYHLNENGLPMTNGDLHTF